MSGRNGKDGKKNRKKKALPEASTSTAGDEDGPGGSGQDTPPSKAKSAGGASEVPKTRKREGYLSWEEYFMAVACLSAQRSKDPVTQVGACIVNQDNKIVGIGYNGMPIGCSDDDMPWGKDPVHPEESKHSYVCHAEMNAIVNKMEADVRGSTVYVTRFPCNECAKLIVQSGIKRIVYFADDRADKPETRVSKRLFARAQVKHSPYMRQPYKTKIELDLNALSVPQPESQ